MTKGNPIIKCRIPWQWLAKIDRAIEVHNTTQYHCEEWDLSAFIRDCIRERLDKPARSKKAKAKSAANKVRSKAECQPVDTDSGGRS